MNKQTLQLCRVKAFCCLLRKRLLLPLLSVIALLSYSQGHSAGQPDTATVTMHLTNAPLEDAFAIIKRQTPYRVIYDNNLVKSAKPVTVSVEKENLLVVLKILFRQQPFGYRVLDESIILTPKTATLIEREPTAAIVIAKDTLISGRVMADSTLLPLAGATVSIKGSRTSTSTDADGRFQLLIPDEGATITVTYVGHATQTIHVNKNLESPLRVLLAATPKEIDEVTVISTGYELLPKERATGSFTQIDKNLFNEQVGTDVLSRLAYISNGVTTYSKSTLGGAMEGTYSIRGLGTLTLVIAKPLIVLDNFPYEGDLININPNDVESVTFLKDAAAGSIWGAKAANGVIVIVTKKGRFNQKTSIEINSNITIGNKPDLFAEQKMAPSDIIDVERMLFQNQYRFSDTASTMHPSFSPVYEILFKARKGQISAAAANEQIDRLRQLDVRDEFEKYFYRKMVNQQYAINFRGGSNNIAWILSAGVDRNISELYKPYNKINLRFDNIYKIAKNFEINTAVYYTNSESKDGRPAYGSISKIPPYFQFHDANGNAAPHYQDYRAGYIDTVGAGKFLDWKYYPADDYKHVIRKSKLQDINTTIGLNYKITGALSIDVKLRYEKQQFEDNNETDEESYQTRHVINYYSQLNRSTGVVKYIVPKGSIFNMTRTNTTAQDARGQINYNNTWGKHQFTAIAGAQISKKDVVGDSYRAYGYDGELLNSVNVDFANRYPNNIDGQSSFINNDNSFIGMTSRFVSFYANGSYVYKSRYTLSGSARKDASNIFGLNTNDKWKPLWSIGGAWDIGGESFYKLRFLPGLKLRITYGKQGNIDPSKVAKTTISYGPTNQFTLSPYSTFLNYANPDLRWEEVAMTNFAIDFRNRDGRISGSVEYFRKDVTDLYSLTPIDMTAGVGGEIVKNVGNMKGAGWDVELNTVNIDGAIKWTSNFIFNTYKAKITRSILPPIEGSQLAGGGFINYQGLSPFDLFAYKWAGLDAAGDPQGYVNGAVTKDYILITGEGTKLADLDHVGSQTPLIFGSIGNAISWKSLSISTRIIYKLKYFFRRASMDYGTLYERLSGSSDYYARWQKPGDELFTTVPVMVYPNNGLRNSFYRSSSILSEHGDHFRLQYINLSYSIRQKMLQKTGLKSVQLYAVANNLGILWRANKHRLDPDYLGIPAPKTYSLGLRIGF